MHLLYSSGSLQSSSSDSNTAAARVTPLLEVSSPAMKEEMATLCSSSLSMAAGAKWTSLTTTCRALCRTCTGHQRSALMWPGQISGYACNHAQLHMRTPPWPSEGGWRRGL